MRVSESEGQAGKFSFRYSSDHRCVRVDSIGRRVFLAHKNDSLAFAAPVARKPTQIIRHRQLKVNRTHCEEKVGTVIWLLKYHYNYNPSIGTSNTD